jgi:NAD(P)-dependent dehydrogenase (short-subunit alcohol dehydrogenase family)
MFEKGLFEGQRILVTGGGTGLGKAMASRFLCLGAEIFICGRRKTVCEETGAELMQRHGGKVTAFGVDIRDAKAVDGMVEEIFASGPLTGLVNNAAGNFIAHTEDLSPRGFDAIANTVMHGTFYVTHAVGRRWIAGGHRGAILSILTTWIWNGGPFTVPSAMSKAAVHAMTMSLASEWGRYGIRLNAIAPGEIPTEGMNKRLTPASAPGDRTAKINPMGRVGTIEELQNLAVFLMSDGCDWLTGQTISMDGAQALATGGNFFDLRNWNDEDWRRARDSIKAQDAKDRADRG